MSWTALIVMCRLVPRKRDGDQRLTRRPCPRQGLPADQCAPETRTPRGCQSVSRSGRAGGETDSATQTSVPLPSASVPSHCRAAFDARPAEGECDGSYSRSPRMQSGRQRGRPRSPGSGGIASTSGNASFKSCRLAPATRTASGAPFVRRRSREPPVGLDAQRGSSARPFDEPDFLPGCNVGSETRGTKGGTERSDRVVPLSRSLLGTQRSSDSVTREQQLAVVSRSLERL
jgi:hypothetical protein